MKNATVCLLIQKKVVSLRNILTKNQNHEINENINKK